MQVIASADIGDLGPTDGKAVAFHFSPLYHVQGCIPWLLLPLAFFALKENRSIQAVWILAPIALLSMIYSAVMRIIRMDSGGVIQLNVMFTIMVVGFSMVWLLAERIAYRNRFVRLLLAAMIYFGFLGVTLLSVGFAKDMITIVALAAISILAIILAFIIAVSKPPKPFNTTRFVIYIGAALFSSLLILFSAIVFIFYPSQSMPLKARVAEVLFASFLGSLIYYAVLLPFLVLLFANSFWRKRFEAISGIETRTVAEPPPWG